MIPLAGDRCSCGHVWTDEEVRRIWLNPSQGERLEAALGGVPALAFLRRPLPLYLANLTPFRSTVVIGTFWA